MWDSLSRVRSADEAESVAPDDDVKALNESWIAWAKVWMGMSIAAGDEVWRVTEPLFEEFRSAYFDRRLPSEEHEDLLRELMRQELGR
jgi:hypothetical protein